MRGKRIFWIALLALPGMLLAGCTDLPDKPPEMAKDLGLDLTNKEKWPLLLAARFPLGVSEEEVVSTFTAQGFEVDRDASTAAYSWGRFPCRADLSAKWKADELGKITHIEGTDWLACP